MKFRTAALISASAVAFANEGTAPAPTTTAPKAPRVEPALTAVFTGLAMPERKNKRGSTSIYPFASLTAVGMCFGVKNKDAASLSSVISNANKKAVKGKVDAEGKPVYKTTPMTDSNGTVVGQAPTTEQETEVTAKFFAVDVDAETKKKIKGTELEGSIALVFREI